MVEVSQDAINNRVVTLLRAFGRAVFLARPGRSAKRRGPGAQIAAAIEEGDRQPRKDHPAAVYAAESREKD